jgi:AcrR family transcriptional regulator
MARWEPNARERLEAAALELFAEYGYQAVTVAQITERAGLTKASYFRYFADKREALFWGQDLLLGAIRRTVTEAGEDARPRELVEAALDAVSAAFTPDRHALAVARQKVVESDPELRERLTAKRAAITETITTALRERGVAATTARVAGHLGQLAFTTAHERWAASADGHGFAEFARDALDEALDAAAGLGGEKKL